MFGGGGMNPRKMKQMMQQMGIDVTELDVEEVIIRTDDADLVFDDAQVTRMDAQGQETYQVVGTPEERESAGAVTAGDDAEETSETNVPEDDIAIVAQRAGVSEDAAREALVDANGDLAAAISALE